MQGCHCGLMHSGTQLRKAMNPSAHAALTTGDPDENPGSPREQVPGRLRGEIWLTIHTRFAQQLIHGRPSTAGKPAITGLLGFADRLRVIWHAAAADDPYADWWLIKVEQALERVDKTLDEAQARLQALSLASAMEIGVSASSGPYRLRLRFATPYAFRAARLVAAFDRTACAVATAQYTGLLTRAAAERLLGRCSKTLRQLFALPHGYRLLDIDRPAVRAGEAAARQAAAIMGDVPVPVLAGEQVPPWHPRRSRSHEGVSPRERISSGEEA